MPTADGGLGTALVGEKIVVNSRSVAVTRLLGEGKEGIVARKWPFVCIHHGSLLERCCFRHSIVFVVTGGFSYVYLVKELSDAALGQSMHSSAHGESTAGQGTSTKAEKRRAGSASGGTQPDKPLMVLKVTSIHSRSQRDIAEKEAKLLSRLSHPSIIKMFDTCYRQTGSSGGGFLASKESNTAKPQHVILMEYCEGGHALDVCNKLAAAGKRFDLSTLIIAFGQICNAVSYLHAQRPPIVHRDLKPVNFLVKNGAYKLCDFGSAVFGHVDLRTPKARAEAEEVIEKTTTQMFRAPEMVDLYSAKRLTQA
jgi:serine/threonine protein kinase